MSTNCVRCVKNPRNSAKASLLCWECEAKEWDDQCRKALAQYPAFASFIETYAGVSRVPREVFIGQTLRMIVDVIKQTEQKLSDRAETTASDLMHACVDNIEEDFLLALRFAYYVRAKPFVPDPSYDEAEKEYINRPEVDDTPLMNPGSDKEEDYPARVRALYNYLGLARMDQSTGKAPTAALSADSSPVKAPKKAKPAKQAPAPKEGLLF